MTQIKGAGEGQYISYDSEKYLKPVSTEHPTSVDDHDSRSMLLQAMAEKQRSLLVLDDPWVPEQVRFLNPIDSAQQTAHRLLVTTRIRELMPKATRVELPLMDEDDECGKT